MYYNDLSLYWPGAPLNVANANYAFLIMTKTHQTRGESSATFSSLSARIDDLEKDIAKGRQDDLLQATKITETNRLNSLVKAYDKNVKITGLTYEIKDSKNLDKKAYEAWSIGILRKSLIDTKVIKEEDVIEKQDGEAKLMRGVISNLHPLGARNNAAIVIAFVEASFANQIKDTVRKNKGLHMGKIKVQVHLPPIIDCLHNEALRARKEEIEKGKKNGIDRKIHCNVFLQSPWIQLIEVTGTDKKPLDFQVEDGRLVDPAATLASLALKGKKFTPLKFLSKNDRESVPTNLTRPASLFQK